ncbi:MAG: UDP-N-acetylmuramoyl-L-alanine--D-glutamate ligase, partial [Endomicrobia bacterium]|nr:UDP-N-acetylmuramoyl-L-alanine--D-glutamate ligase [Endomicrobiia bacterium]
QNYIKAKFNIFKNQTNTDYAVINCDDKNIKTFSHFIKNSNILRFSKKTKLTTGCWLDRKSMYAIFNFASKFVKIKIRTVLPGEHNLENILAAVACSILMDIPKEYIEKNITNFSGVEHRIEFVREIDGVAFINDSKSTNVDSTIVALKSFSKPIHLILGGRDKGAPYTPLIPLIKEKVKTILLIGEATEVIYKQLKFLPVTIYKCGDLETAVKTAKKIAKKGEIVLLSPACSSFDQFSNFEHRGNEFKRLVDSL